MNTALIYNSYKVILDSPPERQFTIAFIGILQGYLSKVTKKHLADLNISSVDNITLKHLALLQGDTFKHNAGFNGVCWEYSIYNLIKYENDFLINLLNQSINMLTRDNKDSEIDCVLWGTEKKEVSAETIKYLLTDDSTLWTAYGEYNFKAYLDFIADGLRKEKARSMLPSHIKNVWKSDLFIKRRNEDSWFGVNVKWNKSECKYERGIPIGIYFNTDTDYYNSINPLPIKSQAGVLHFAMCGLPFFGGFGQFYNTMFNFFQTLLANVNRPKKTSNFQAFPNPILYLMFEHFHDRLIFLAVS